MPSVDTDCLVVLVSVESRLDRTVFPWFFTLFRVQRVQLQQAAALVSLALACLWLIEAAARRRTRFLILLQSLLVKKKK